MWTALALITLLTPTSETPRGFYVEARTASVFAGACHYGSEYTTQGREVALGFAIEEGSHDGVSLAGLELAALVVADRNLADPEGQRRSIVYVPADCSDAVCAAAVAWLRDRHAAVLGTVTAVERAAVDVGYEAETDAFRLTAGKSVALTGRGLPERECCKMPYARWYDPEVPVTKSIVGCTERFDVAAPSFKLRWSRAGENSVLFGRFGVVEVEGV